VCMVTYPCTIKQENSKVLSNLWLQGNTLVWVRNC
jgi:hypothetical protein